MSLHGGDDDKVDLEELLAEKIKWIDDFDDATDEEQDAARRRKDYYDGFQWTDAEIKELRERGQPCITFNRIQKKANAVFGHEVRTRRDPEALPRSKAHEDAAIAATDGLRYVSDRENVQRKRGKVLKSIFIQGYAGTHVGVERQPSGEFDVKLRHIPFHRVAYDHHSEEEDFSDAQHMSIITWYYIEQAKERYPGEEAHALLDEALSSGSESVSNTDTFEDRPRKWVDTKRKRVKVMETYYEKDGQWNACHFVVAGFLRKPALTGLMSEDGQTNLNPMILASAFVDEENNRYGPVKHMMSPQDELNKRRSKMLHQATMRQVAYEERAVESVDSMLEELAKPDGAVLLNDGAMTDGSWRVLENGDQKQGQAELLAHAAAEIDSIGPSAEGAIEAASGSGVSGRALQQHAKAATMELEPLFDAVRDWEQRVYEAIWQRIRQFKTEEWWVRVRDDETRKGWRFVGMNQNMTKLERLKELLEKEVELLDAMKIINASPQAFGAAGQAQQQFQQQVEQAQAQAREAQAAGQLTPPLNIPPDAGNQAVLQALSVLPEMSEVIKANDISALEVDIVLTTTPDTAVIEQEEFDRLGAIAPAIIQAKPELAGPVTKLLILASQIRNKEKLAEAFDETDKPDPAAEQAAQEAAEMRQMQMQALQAQVTLFQAQAESAMAQAGERAASAQEKQAKAEIAIPAEADKDMALAERHASEAQGEIQSQRQGDLQPVGDALPLPLPSE